MAASTQGLSIIDADPDLAAGLPQEDLLLARRVLMRPRYEIPAGGWNPGLLTGHEGCFGLLVVDGAILREVHLGERDCAQLLGPGDVLQEPSSDLVIACPVSWYALTPSVIVGLDERFSVAARRWPELARNLHLRLLAQADRVALHAATAQLPRVERRIVALFWQLADRWGRVTSAGVELSLPLTHEVLGRLVGAQRPTVSLALRELSDSGTLRSPARHTWLLSLDSREDLWGVPAAHAAHAVAR